MRPARPRSPEEGESRPPRPVVGFAASAGGWCAGPPAGQVGDGRMASSRRTDTGPLPVYAGCNLRARVGNPSQ